MKRSTTIDLCTLLASPALFPSTRYQGSKRRLLPWLYENLSGLEFETILDAYGGSGSASYLFKAMGKKVHFNDVLKSNHQTGIALIENSNVTLDAEDIQFVLADRERKHTTFIADTFKGIYYYAEENAWLDMIVFNIKSLSSTYTGETLRKKQALAFHALFQACLSKRPFNLFHRKNLYLRGANVSRTFYNKTTWDTGFPKLFRRYALEASSKVFTNNQKNKASCRDVLSLPARDYDLIYLDPPYQRPQEPRPKDYLSLYHFLEGLVDYDNWSSKIDYSKNHRPLRQKSDQNDLTTLQRIGCILEKFQSSIVAISYGEPGVPTIAELTGLVRKYKTSVKTFDTEYSYKLNKRNGDQLREVLIVGS